MPVGLVERAGNLDGRRERLVQWKRALLQARGDGFALQILHHQIIDTVLLANVVQWANVWMAQARNGLRLALEPLARLRVDREVFGKNLDRKGRVRTAAPLRIFRLSLQQNFHINSTPLSLLLL
jgi:hypothetical protein